MGKVTKRDAWNAGYHLAFSGKMPDRNYFATNQPRAFYSGIRIGRIARKVFPELSNENREKNGAKPL